MNRVFEDRRFFVAVMLVACGPPIFAAYDMRAASLFALGLLLWGLLPVAIAYVIFHFRRQYAAWGWLIGVTGHGYFSLAYVLQSESSTAAIDFLWAPAWNIVVFGPAGALLGAVLARVRGLSQPS
jgi:hypothetical protein